MECGLYKQKHGGLKTRSSTFQRLVSEIFKQGFELFKKKKMKLSVWRSDESLGSKGW